jgi:hypothetical protein
MFKDFFIKKFGLSCLSLGILSPFLFIENKPDIADKVIFSILEIHGL